MYRSNSSGKARTLVKSRVGSEESGQAAATLLSLVQTCRALNINPRTYLEDVSRRIMGHNARKVHELLPDEWLRGQI